MTATADHFTRTRKLLGGVDYGCDLSGSQVYVSVFGEPVFEEAVGSRLPGEPMTLSSSMVWICCSKSVALFPLAHFLSAHGLDEDTEVRSIVPEYAQAGKENTRISHLLTNTVAYRSLGLSWAEGAGAVSADESDLELLPFDEALAAVCREPVSAEPGTSVTYTGISNWTVLGGIIERVSGLPYETAADDLLMKPLSLTRSRTSLQPADLSYWEQTHSPLRFFEADGSTHETSYEYPPVIFQRWPGAGVRGPAADMAKPIECIAGWNRAGLLSEAWRKKFTNAARSGLPDPLYGGKELLWSLGLCADPVLFGLKPGRRVVGLTGKRSSMVVADLDSGVTISFLSSKLVHILVDWHRKTKLVKAVLADLGISL